MTRKLRRGRWVFVVPAAFIIAFGWGAALAGSRLECTKDAPRLEDAQKVSSKQFLDDLPRVSALEKAARRGRAGGDRDVIRLLALRVEFQPDDDPRGTGDGTFDYSEWDEASFDGTPHDKTYFDLHMTALYNYYYSASYGNLEIDFTVAPADTGGAYVVPHDMGYYHDYSEEQVWYVSQVEEFVRDAFAAADTTDTLDFCDYDGYIIFHAGADWQSDVYLDSPFDLPSAHLSLGEPILVNDGTCEVWESAILPETSSQDGLQIVLNGTLAHEVGHILGLPDLYNTFNFFPAVGYWSIMDSGGRIGMNTPWGYAFGLIPTAPCSWSKEYMGWIDPPVILEDQDDVEVRGTVLRGGGNQLLKIPLTSREYFLIENRFDDLNKDNTVVIEQERGVVLGPVDPDCTQEICPVNNEYDFLLPGPGLMIWHIDDTRVIPGLMPYDTVNYDRYHRGVAVEEADGIMDLGNIGSFYWTGSAYDPFYAANNDSFSWDTYPSTDNNFGGKTYVSVTRISAPDTVMTMNVGFDRWKDGWPIDIGERIGPISPRVADLDGDGLAEIVVGAESGNIYAWHADGTPVLPSANPPGFFAEAFGGLSYTPALVDLDTNGDLEVIASSAGGELFVWDHVDLNDDGSADLHSSGFPVDIGGAASSPPVAADFDSGPGLEIAAASQGGYLTLLDRTGGRIGSSPYSFGHLILNDVTIAAGDLDGDLLDEIVLSTTNRGWVAALDSDGTSVPGWPVTVPSWVDGTAGVLVGDIDRAPDGAPEVVGVGSNGEVHVWDRSGRELEGWPVRLERGVLARGALADLDADGFLEIALSAGARSVVGLRMNGTRAENWPLVLDPGDSLSTNGCPPILGDIDDDGELDVIVGGPGGNLFGWGAVTGESIPGWPISSDPSLGSPWVGDADDDGEIDVLVAGDAGRVLFYRMPYAHKAANIIWPTEAGSASGTGAYPDSLLPAEPDETEGLLVDDRTYCYPNPAKTSDLTVRVYLEESASLDIQIMDVSGQVVRRFDVDGVPTVNEIVWETSGVASGLYLVRVEASVPEFGSGPGKAGSVNRSEVKIMKAAVIR